MDEEDLTGLSEQERAALAETTDDESALRAIADRAPPPAPVAAAPKPAAAEGGEDDAALEDKPDETPAPAPAATPAPTTAPQAAAPAATPAPAPEQPVVVFTATAPEDAEEQIKALRAKKAAAFKQLMDGEITAEAYSATEDEVTSQVSAIEREVTTASVATKLTLENAQRSYLGKVKALIDRAGTEGVDYRGNKELHDALDRTVKWLANDPSNADKPEQWFLDEAHTMVKTRFGLAKTAAAPAATPAPAPATRSGKAPDVGDLPPNISRQPAAGGAEDGGEFGHLANLKGMDLERAVARMTTEQQQRWAEEA